MSPALERLFSPRAIAVVGASADPTRPGGQTIEALRRNGYRGSIYPVNPARSEIAGLSCYPSIAAIPDGCDLAVIAVAAASVPDLMDQCGAKSIPHAVVVGGGFRETGAQGARIEADMLARARRHGIRFVGPNGLGLVNVPERVYACFGSLTREPRLRPGGVSAVIQSGGFGNSLVIQCALAGVGFRYVVAGGNETDLNCCDLIDAFVDDPDTRVILTYIEGVADGRAFVEAARRALGRGKPVLAWKGGRTATGTRVARTHTGSLTGSYDAWRAAFRQSGVIEVDEVYQTAEFACALDCGRLPRGRRVAVMGGSGGTSVVFSDAADEVGLSLPALAPETEAAVRAALPAIGSLKNPIDYTSGQPRPEKRRAFALAVEAVLTDPNVDMLAMTLATASTDKVHVIAEVLHDSLARCDKPVLVFTPMPDGMIAEAAEVFRAARIPVLRSPRAMARTMATLASFAESVAQPEEGAAAGEALSLPVLPSGSVQLDELESKQLLAAAGLPVTRDVLLPVAGDIPPGVVEYPAVVKVLSRDTPHKSDLGGVRFGIGDDPALAIARDEVVAAARSVMPGARIAGAIASETVTDALEMLVGVSNDAVFGPVVVLGMGGIFAEGFDKRAYRIAPFGISQAQRMIDELGGHRIFGGLRARQPRDVEALAAALARVSVLAWQLRDRLSELDVNPLMVLARGRGVVAADALAVLR